MIGDFLQSLGFRPGVGYRPGEYGAEFYNNRVTQKAPQGPQGASQGPSGGTGQGPYAGRPQEPSQAAGGPQGAPESFGPGRGGHARQDLSPQEFDQRFRVGEPPPGVGEGPYAGRPQAQAQAQAVGNYDPSRYDTFADLTQFHDPFQTGSIEASVQAKYSDGRHVPVTIRNNNPGGISLGESSAFVEGLPGYVGKTPRPKSEGGYYARFATPEAGVHAASEVLKRYGQRGIDTPEKIVQKWSTDKTAWPKYAQTLAKALGVKPGDKVDLSSPEVRKAILMAQSGHESGSGRPVYNDHVYASGVQDDLDDYVMAFAPKEYTSQEFAQNSPEDQLKIMEALYGRR